MLKPTFACLGFVELLNVFRKSLKCGPRLLLVWISLWKKPVRARLVYWVGPGLRESVGWGQSPVSQVSGESDLVPTCAYGLCWGRAQARNNGACGHFSSRESCLLPLALKVDSSLPPECSWCLQTSAPSLEFSASVCEQMGLCLSPLRECLVCSSPPSHPDWVSCWFSQPVVGNHPPSSIPPTPPPPHLAPTTGAPS